MSIHTPVTEKVVRGVRPVWGISLTSFLQPPHHFFVCFSSFFCCCFLNLFSRRTSSVECIQMHTEHKVHECSRLELTRHCFPVIAAAAARSDPRRVTDGAPGTEPVRPVPVRTDRARARTAPPAARYPGGVQPNLKPSLAAVAFHASGSPLTPTTTYIAKATAWFRSRCTAPRRARTRPSHRRQPRPTLKLKRSRSAPVPPPRPSR